MTLALTTRRTRVRQVWPAPVAFKRITKKVIDREWKRRRLDGAQLFFRGAAIPPHPASRRFEKYAIT
jgi:hypothetical protein